MIIDEKGRLFGKVNIIDFLLILFLISVTPMFYFGYKIFNQPPPSPPPAPPPPPPPVIVYASAPIELYGAFKGIPNNIADLITSGDMEKNKEGKVIGTILNIIRREEYVAKYDMGGAVAAEIKYPNKSQMFIKLSLLPEIKDNSIFYKGVKIALNSAINFSTAEYEITGTISPPPSSPPDQNWMQIRVVFDNMLPDIARLLKKDDIETDRNGMTVGKIKKILKVNTAEQLVFLQDEGKYKYVKYPGYRSVELFFDVLTERRKDGIYYKNDIIAVGRGFVFQSNKYYISGTIVGMSSF